MKINVLELSNKFKTLLLEDIFPLDLLESIHVLCEQSELNESGWNFVEWSKFRKIYKGNNETYAEIQKYLSSNLFTGPIEEIIKLKMSLTDFSLWADYPGFGSLLPHVEQHGQGQGQIYLTRKEHATNGTSIMNDNKQLLTTLPYRNNFGWYMDDCKKIMHSRDYDVPKDIIRYSLIYWHDYQ